MKNIKFLSIILFVIICGDLAAQTQASPDNIRFVRQGVKRLIFDRDQSISLAILNPKQVIGMSAMYPTKNYMEEQAVVDIVDNKLSVQSEKETKTGIWFGGFNPFATYSLDLVSCLGKGEIGFEFSDAAKTEQFFITIAFNDEQLVDVKQKIIIDSKVIVNESIATNIGDNDHVEGKVILQMLGSGLVLYLQNGGLPIPIGESEFNQFIDLRKMLSINTFQSKLFLHINGARVIVDMVESTLSSGIGLADIRLMTYENGDPLLDRGRIVVYTVS